MAHARMHEVEPIPMPRENVVVAALENPEADWEESLEEMERLVDTANGRVVAIVTQRRDKPEPATYLGKGKVEETKAIIEEHAAQLLVIDGELSPSQQRNIERMLEVQVIDRTGIILDIFAHRAQTAEGKLQVELAQLEYLLPRLTNMWSHLSRIKRGIGMRGPGETQLEVDRRRVRERIADLQEKVREIRHRRAVQRSQRAQSQIPMVSLVGYTNAGKSTLLNALSGAGVFVEDKLFATLDPTTRDVNFPNGTRALVSDTVGFIRNLPTQLVAAFRATLEEVQSADVLVHVIDASNPGWVEQEETVDRVLAELGAADKPTIMAFNKMDEVEEPELLAHLAARYPHVVFLAAKKGRGIEELEDMITAVLRERWQPVDAVLPLTAGDLVAELHARGEVDTEEYEGTSVHLTGKAPADLAARISWRAQQTK
ncbi:MAG: GTPase HflX [bacterium ADurb.Bin429]|nr:MAG: GTPase HflX [bacterium ADurb.Bin429]